MPHHVQRIPSCVTSYFPLCGEGHVPCQATHQEAHFRLRRSRQSPLPRSLRQSNCTDIDPPRTTRTFSFFFESCETPIASIALSICSFSMAASTELVRAPSAVRISAAVAEVHFGHVAISKSLLSRSLWALDLRVANPDVALRPRLQFHLAVRSAPPLGQLHLPPGPPCSLPGRISLASSVPRPSHGSSSSSICIASHSSPSRSAWPSDNE